MIDFVNRLSQGDLFSGLSWWLGGSVVKNSPANGGATGHAGSSPGSGRSPGGGRGNALQHSCLENPKDRGAWQSMVSQSWT